MPKRNVATTVFWKGNAETKRVFSFSFEFFVSRHSPQQSGAVFAFALPVHGHGHSNEKTSGFSRAPTNSSHGEFFFENRSLLWLDSRASRAVSRPKPKKYRPRPVCTNSNIRVVLVEYLDRVGISVVSPSPIIPTIHLYVISTGNCWNIARRPEKVVRWA